MMTRALCSNGRAGGPAARDRVRKKPERKASGLEDSPGLQQRAPFLPKSVFSAGTAKRTAEMLRRKEALASLGDEQEEEVEEEVQRDDQAAVGAQTLSSREEPSVLKQPPD